MSDRMLGNIGTASESKRVTTHGIINNIGQIERGERCPSLTTLIKIANALDTSGSKILADAEQKLDEE